MDSVKNFMVTIKIEDQQYRADLSKPLDLSIPLQQQVDQVNCFYAPLYYTEPVRAGDFIGDTLKGGPVNFKNIHINPHGNGTHTECVGHISSQGETINKTLLKYHFTAQLVSVYPMAIGEDRIVNLQSFTGIEIQKTEAIIIRTLPNSTDKLSRNYSGQNPPFLDSDLIKVFNDKGIEHLLVDLPSVDREEDGGKLLAHKAFWNYPENSQLQKTITELIYIDNEISDGLYLLNIQIGAFDIDASPSKPIIYRLEKIES